MNGNKRLNEAALSLPDGRLIFDRHRQLGNFEATSNAVNTDINKEAKARDIVFDENTPPGKFVEIGCGDGKLAYLLGNKGNFDYSEELYRQNRTLFDNKFEYAGIDMYSEPSRNIFEADICDERFEDSIPIHKESVAVAYSNNVFEHLRKPWQAAKNIYNLLQLGGVGVIIVPFSLRYHQSPDDYFRFSHVGIASLFEDAGSVETISSGYDILGRRNNWQGGGAHQDIVPVDAFGAWREAWFTFYAFRRIG